MGKGRDINNFNYTPKTKGNGILYGYKVGESFESSVRILDKLYYSENGFSIFRA